ncbi:MAG: helix-turn-helix domain-containing protein [Patescibacteria group bacterium]
MNILKNEGELVSIGEAAKILGVAIQTLRRWDQEGKLVARKTTGGQRRYSRPELKRYSSSDIYKIAHLWATNKTPTPLEDDVYCQTRAVFEVRLQRFSQLLETSGVAGDTFSLIVSAVGEIGNNSFDHNIGNWPDVPGLFFDYDIDLRQVVLADRGQGILTTLQRVRPALYLHTDALEVAFTEVLTGRAPEKRGNGLKFVSRKVIQKGVASITFQTGNAKLSMEAGSSKFNMEITDDHVRGTLVSFEFNAKN